MAQLSERIFLCGFMGAGKSSTGLNLAERLDLPFKDLDTLIVERENMPISEIFDRYGESYFRDKEREAVLSACENLRGIIALGGGALHDQDLVNDVKENGLLVFIAARLTHLIERIRHDKNRPLLLDEYGKLKPMAQLENELGKLYNERRKWYKQAHIRLQSDDYQSPEQAAKALEKKIKDYEENR